MIKIAVTGGIGSGKSYISHLLENMHIPVYNADNEAKRLTVFDAGIRGELIALLGEEVYKDGLLNKPLLASYLFSNPAHVLQINSIIHPRVRKDFTVWVERQEKCEIVGMESAILYEAGFQDTVDAVERTVACGILTGGHVILGLPGETHEDLVAQAATLSRLPITTLKMHQLQLIRGTRMAHEYEQHPEDFHLFGVEEYIDLVIDYIEHLRPDLVLERFVSQSPKELLIAPDWGLKNYEFNHRVQKRMKELGAYQGKKYEM